MKNYARVEEGAVLEVISVEDDFDMSSAFNPSLQWVECDESVVEGWTYNGKKFVAPKPAQPDPDAAAASARTHRDSLLRSFYDPAILMAQRALRKAVTDADKDYAEQKISELDNFANLLQDIPEQKGFPFQIEWPQTPEL